MTNHDPVVEAKIRRGSAKPKFQIGDIVFELPDLLLLFTMRTNPVG